MGIPGLWKILEPTSHNTSLIEISVKEGFLENRHGTRSVVVGVDASPMIYAAQAAFSGPRHPRAQAGQNPELRALFFRLAWLSRSGVSAVFVFDGPNRPEQKHNKRVCTTPHWMTQRFQDLVKGFGFHCHTAPGEAEAELAYLNACQAIDVIITSDNDVFLFGAKQVIRSPTDSRHLDNVSVFTEDRFNDQHSGLFTVPGFLLMAVLSGGDYNTAGLPNCGPTIASALAKGPLADQLYNAAKTLPESKFCDFLTSWRVSLQNELIHDPDGRLGRRYSNIAENIPSTFPDPKIVRQYCCPVTSAQVPQDAVAWLIPKLPDTSALADLCDRLFDWGPNILDRFISYVWDGYLIRRVIQAFYRGNSIPNAPPSHVAPTFNGINKIQKKRSQSAHLSSEISFYQVNVWIPSLTAEAATSVLDSCSGRQRPSIHGITFTHSMAISIPTPILQVTNPELVQMYHSSHPRVKPPQPWSTYTPVIPTNTQ